MIIHADMDAFFAAVEIREQPALRDRPVVVGGSANRRGVVAAASYAARRYGIHSAMPMASALKRCPELVVLPVRMALYSAVSRQIQAIFARYTPLIEPLSLDEAFLDVSASTALFGPAPQIGRAIQQAVRDELGLVVSIGVAPSKFVAKIASDLQKPAGFVVVAADAVQAFLDPLPIGRLWGVGRVTEHKLRDLKIRRIGDLRQYSESELHALLGKHGVHLWHLAHGHDPRTVTPEHEAKSLSHETTFARDIRDADTLRAVLSNLTEQVAWRLRQQDLQGRSVQLKLRFDDFQTITRAHSLAAPTHDTRTLWRTVLALLERELAAGLPPVRLIGMGVSGFSDDISAAQQLGLFDAAQAPRAENNPVDRVSDAINQRFGKQQLTRARGLHGSRNSR